MIKKLRVYIDISADDTGSRSIRYGFRQRVMDVLNDPRGWTRAGIEFVYTADQKKNDIGISISRPGVIQKLCQFAGMSCTLMRTRRAHINSERWVHGAEP